MSDLLLLETARCFLLDLTLQIVRMCICCRAIVAISQAAFTVGLQNGVSESRRKTDLLNPRTEMI